MARKAIIIGAGPAGLTAAFELLDKTDVIPIILEKSGDIGGLSKTVNYKGNRIDIGGHRFFSKSDRIIAWWLNILPLSTDIPGDINLRYHNKDHKISVKSAAIGPEDDDRKMLIRSRKSRIYYLKKFFSYPISLSFDTLGKLGPLKIAAILSSYLHARLFPIRDERTLEDFFINRFGKNLYKTFFKDYTEKVWGKSCREISSEWGAPRIKGLSIKKTIGHALNKLLLPGRNKSIAQKNVETSLIEHFMYPKYGPGQLWEEVARIVKEKGGEIYFNQDVKDIQHDGKKIISVQSRDTSNGAVKGFAGDFFFSTMPVKDLIGGFAPAAPAPAAKVAAGLEYRDFITVGILVDKLKTQAAGGRLIEDNWIYIQEKDVKVGRLQVFNNWSPFMVKDADTVWLGLEYFCNEGDEIWNLSDKSLIQLGIDELFKMNLIEKNAFIDGTVIRMEKTYPAYFGTYQHFDTVRKYLDGFDNLFLIGRNGMHKYNNADHSMLTAICAVENIAAGSTRKDNIWKINTEDEYHE